MGSFCEPNSIKYLYIQQKNDFSRLKTYSELRYFLRRRFLDISENFNHSYNTNKVVFIILITIKRWPLVSLFYLHMYYGFFRRFFSFQVVVIFNFLKHIYEIFFYCEFFVYCCYFVCVQTKLSSSSPCRKFRHQVLFNFKNLKIKVFFFISLCFMNWIYYRLLLQTTTKKNYMKNGSLKHT